MATLTRASVSLATMNPPPPHQLTKAAFAALTAGDLVYIKSDDTFAKADGTAADAKALYWGMVNHDAAAGEFVTAYHGVEFNYGTGLTVGARYYASATAGSADDAATTGGTVPAAIATSATRIYIISPTR